MFPYIPEDNAIGLHDGESVLDGQSADQCDGINIGLESAVPEFDVAQDLDAEPRPSAVDGDSAVPAAAPSAATPGSQQPAEPATGAVHGQSGQPHQQQQPHASSKFFGTAIFIGGSFIFLTMPWRTLPRHWSIIENGTPC